MVFETFYISHNVSTVYSESTIGVANSGTLLSLSSGKTIRGSGVNNNLTLVKIGGLLVLL